VRVFVALLAGSLLAGSAFAQGKCQSRCLDSGSCQASCTDDRCMKRCSARTQACMEACEKTDPASINAKQVKMNGTCPGPGGRMISCDQIPQQAPSEKDVSNMIQHPHVKPKDHNKEESKFPKQMPTADNYQQLYEQQQKANKGK
jgi:hypothetical protein